MASKPVKRSVATNNGVRPKPAGRRPSGGPRANAAGSLLEGYVECQVFPGMFSNEWGIVIEREGEAISLYAPKTAVKDADENAHSGLLLVKVWDARKNIVTLPAATLERGSSFMNFPISELRPA